jgi:protein xylosyltransferase
VALNRAFAEFVVNDRDETILGLKEYFKYALLPAEAFFHMALRNSRFCSTKMNNNLHPTNWNRTQGCKCEYKTMCGCSPNVYLSN